MIKTIYLDGVETNYEISDCGQVFNKITHRELKGTYARNEYHTVQLTVNGKLKTVMVHRLAAVAFCENPNNYNIVDHIDGNKLNNNAANLRWVRAKDNSLNIPWDKIKPRERQFLEKEDFHIEDWKSLHLIDDRYLIDERGRILNKETLCILRPAIRNGYYRVCIQHKNYSVHILLWEAFNGKILEGYEIDHIDGNKLNNDLTNLRLVNHSENMHNAMRNNSHAQVPIKQYDLNGNFIAEYPSIRAAANAVGGNEIAIKDASLRYGSSAGYIWIRKNDDVNVHTIIANKRIGKHGTQADVYQYDQDYNLVATYSSIKEAADNIGCNVSTIYKSIRFKRLGKGFYWTKKSITDNEVRP